MGFIHIQNSNFGANRYTDNIDNLFKNCIVQLFPSLGTTGTFPVSDINGSFGIMAMLQYTLDGLIGEGLSQTRI